MDLPNVARIVSPGTNDVNCQERRPLGSRETDAPFYGQGHDVTWNHPEQ